MDRRQSLKYITLGSLASGALIAGCETKKDIHQEHQHAAVEGDPQRPEAEKVRDARLMQEKFFTDDEMATITVLANLVIPADEHSGSASDSGVPDFIEFMAKDRPEMQTPLRGGLRWLDLEALTRYDKNFRSCNESQQTSILDDIAFPDTAKPEMQQGVAFFNRFRDLVASGFWTSKIGIADIGYQGNMATVWDGPPNDVMESLGISYDPELLPKYVKSSDRDKPMDFSNI